MEEKGILVVVSGFSGAGKGTLTQALLKKYDNYALSVSATTRKPRKGEIEGVHYFYKSVSEFEEMIRKNSFIEYAQYVGNYYGTPKSYVEEQLAKGKDVILEIEVQGALKVKEKFPRTVLIFVTTPSTEVLKERLIGRGTESIDIITKRLVRAGEETENMEEYDYILINDDLEESMQKMHHIIQSEHAKASRNIKFINKMREDIKSFSKGE